MTYAEAIKEATLLAKKTKINWVAGLGNGRGVWMVLPTNERDAYTLRQSVTVTARGIHKSDERQHLENTARSVLIKSFKK